MQDIPNWVPKWIGFGPDSIYSENFAKQENWSSKKGTECNSRSGIQCEKKLGSTYTLACDVGKLHLVKIFEKSIQLSLTISH